jgi:hypothetical protein
MLSKTDDDGVLSDVLAADLKNYIDATTYEFRMHHAVASDSIKRAFST